MEQRPEFFSNFGWPDYLFYLQGELNIEIQKILQNAPSLISIIISPS
jgi:hypothetical protein